MERITRNKLVSRLTMLTVVCLFTSLTNPLNAQFGVLPEVLLETQAEVDNFSASNDPILAADLTIIDNGSDPITNLDGLNSLIFLFGDLTIMGNTELNCYSGLIPLLQSNGLIGSYTVAGNLINPTENEILAGEACIEAALTFEEIIQALLDDGVLNKGRANALTKQAGKSLNGLLGHLQGFVNAGILTEDEALLLFDAASL